MHIVDEMFAWPQGIVVGNLIASSITGTIMVIRNEIHHKRTQRLLKENSNGANGAGAAAS